MLAGFCYGSHVIVDCTRIKDAKKDSNTGQSSKKTPLAMDHCTLRSQEQQQPQKLARPGQLDSP